MHASSLSLHLRRALVAALATPLAAACGGIADSGDGGNPQQCNATSTDAGVAACGSTNVRLSGDLAKCNLDDGSGNVPQATCVALCGGQQYSYCTFDSSSDVLTCQSFCTGRLPACLREEDDAGNPRAVGEYLARVAYLEAAAVDAFAILAAELRAHGAPRSLVRSARRIARPTHSRSRASSRDEVHARIRQPSAA